MAIASILLPIIIVLIVLAVALVGGLAFVMTRPSELRPHRPGRTGNRHRLRRRPWQARADRERERKEHQDALEAAAAVEATPSSTD